LVVYLPRLITTHYTHLTMQTQKVLHIEYQTNKKEKGNISQKSVDFQKEIEYMTTEKPP